MSGGYTPAFASIYDGTLYGKWPTAAVWASLLPLIDAQGEINLSYEAISGRTGWPMELLKTGIVALMQPDPGSQSSDEEGRRLVLISPAREWGWRAVNVKKYRDKASGRNQVNDGRNAEKVRRYKDRHRKTPVDTSGHRSTHQDTYSDSYTNKDTNKDTKNPPTPLKGADGLDELVWTRWLDYRKQIRKPLKPVSIPAAQRELAAFGSNQAAVVEKSIAEGWTGLFELRSSTSRGPPLKRKTADEAEAEARARGEDPWALTA